MYTMQKRRYHKTLRKKTCQHLEELSGFVVVSDVRRVRLRILAEVFSDQKGLINLKEGTEG